MSELFNGGETFGNKALSPFTAVNQSIDRSSDNRLSKENLESLNKLHKKSIDIKKKEEIANH